MKLLSLLAILLSSLSLSAFGSATETRCASPDGSVEIINDHFYDHGKEVAYPHMRAFDRHLVQYERKTCHLLKADRDVIAYDLRAYKQHIIYTNGGTFEADLRCEEVSHAIPAGDACAH